MKKIVLVEDGKVITEETDLTKIFKDQFEIVVQNLHIERPCKVYFDREPVVNAIKNFSQHPNILKIKENMNSSACFSFLIVSKEGLLYQVNSLDPTKTTQSVIFQRILLRRIITYFQSFFLQTLMILF